MTIYPDDRGDGTSPFTDLFDQNRLSDLHKIQQGSYDWGRQPLWRRHLACSKPDLKRRRELVTRLCDDPTGDPTAAEIGLDILTCTKRYPCGSPLCDLCRTHCQDDRQTKALRLFGHLGREQLAFLTVLTEVTYEPEREVRLRVDELRDKVRALGQHPRLHPVRVFGAIEVDVKFPKLHLRGRAKEVLAAHGMIHPTKEAYLVHLHALVDLRGAEREELRRWLKRTFPRKYQVRLAHLRADRTTAENVKALTRYMFKFRAQEADNLWGNLPDGKAKYGSLYQSATLRSYAKCLHRIKGGRKFAGFYLTYNVR